MVRKRIWLPRSPHPRCPLGPGLSLPPSYSTDIFHILDVHRTISHKIGQQAARPAAAVHDGAIPPARLDTRPNALLTHVVTQQQLLQDDVAAVGVGEPALVDNVAPDAKVVCLARARAELGLRLADELPRCTGARA
jgi:hypothetical protein